MCPTWEKRATAHVETLVEYKRMAMGAGGETLVSFENNLMDFYLLNFCICRVVLFGAKLMILHR
jgi:hypothetical protein